MLMKRTTARVTIWERKEYLKNSFAFARLSLGFSSFFYDFVLLFFPYSFPSSPLLDSTVLGFRRRFWSSFLKHTHTDTTANVLTCFSWKLQVYSMFDILKYHFTPNYSAWVGSSLSKRGLYVRFNTFIYYDIECQKHPLRILGVKVYPFPTNPLADNTCVSIN